MDRSFAPAEALEALPILQRIFGDRLLAVYLHGSAVAGGLRPGSDVDLLAIVDRPTTHADRERLVAELLKISGSKVEEDGRRPLELFVFCLADLAGPPYPARSEFLFGEWLRAEFEAGAVPEPVADPDNTLVLAQAARNAIPLLGPGRTERLPIVPEADIGRAISGALPALRASLEGDERNVLLTLARMWYTLATGGFVSKDAAADWAMPKLAADDAALLGHAREAYLGLVEDDWSDRGEEARRLAATLQRQIVARL